MHPVIGDPLPTRWMKLRFRSHASPRKAASWACVFLLKEQGQPVMDGVSVSRSRSIRVVLFAASLCLAQSGACTPYIGTTYKSFIRQARENPDPNIRYIAYAKLGTPSLYEDKAQKDEAVKIMVAKLEDGREPVAIRAAIIRSLGNLGDRRARGVILRGVGDTDDALIRVEACRALGKVGLPEDATTLARIMTIDKLEDCRIAAIEAIGSLKAHEPRIYQILLDGMDHDDPAIRFQCLQSLRTITENDYGIDPEVWRRELQPVLAGTAKAPATVEASAAASEKQASSKTILGPN